MTLTLPPFGRIRGSVTKPDGSPAGTTARIKLAESGRLRDADTSSEYAFDGVPVGVTTVQAWRKDYNSAGTKGHIDTKVSVVSDGDEIVVNTRTQAVASVIVTVKKPDGSAYPAYWSA